MEKLYPHLLKGTNWVLAGLLTLLGFSCSSDLDNDDDLLCEYGSPHANYEIKGKVVDRQNNPIPDIQIEIRDSVPSRGWAHSDTLYTNNAGEFVWNTGEFPGMTFKLTAIDIDDESNGGVFARDTSFVSFKNAKYVGGDGRWNSGTATLEPQIVMDKYVDTHKEPYALYTIYGRVVDEEGYSLPGIVISTSPGYFPEKPESDLDYPAITNDHGMYSFTYDQAAAVEHTIQTSFFKGHWNIEAYAKASQTINFADIELSGGKGMLIGKGSKEVNFVLKKK